MLRILLFITLMFIAKTCMAGPLEGVFGHEYTRSKNAAVWTLRPTADQLLTVTHHGDGTVARIHVWDEKEKSGFWSKMLWNPKTATQAQCAGNGEEVFCYVPRLARQQIDWLQDYASDYFNYTEMGGIMQIQRVGN